MVNKDELHYTFAEDLPVCTNPAHDHLNDTDHGMRLENECCPGYGFEISAFRQIEAMGIKCENCGEGIILLKIARKEV